MTPPLCLPSSRLHRPGPSREICTPPPLPVLGWQTNEADFVKTLRPSCCVEIRSGQGTGEKGTGRETALPSSMHLGRSLSQHPIASGMEPLSQN